MPRHLAPHRPSTKAPGTTVGQAFIMAAAALALGALLNARALEATAESQPFGWRHDVATALARPLVDISDALHLDAPRRWLEDALDRPHPQTPGGRPDPFGTTTTTSVPVTTSSVPTGSSSSTSTSTTLAPLRRVPTVAEPLRLLVVGDSMTEALGPALVNAAGATDVVAARHELRYSSGLARPDFFDWPAELRSMVEDSDPEAIVVMIGANDGQGMVTASGVAPFGSDAWVTEYRNRVSALMSLLEAGGRVVYWVGEPVMRSSEFDARMALITEIARDEATRHEGVRFVASRPVFVDDRGGYSAYLPGADGAPVLVRRDDGIHLTPAGGSRLATAVMAAIGQDWELEG